MNYRRNDNAEAALGCFFILGTLGVFIFDAINGHIKGPVTDRLRSQNGDSFNGVAVEIIICQQCGQANMRIPGKTHTCGQCGTSLFAPGETIPALQAAAPPPPQGLTCGQVALAIVILVGLFILIMFIQAP